MLEFLPEHWLIPQSVLGFSFLVALLLAFIIALIAIVFLTVKSAKRVKQVRSIVEGESLKSLYDNRLIITERANASEDKVIKSLWNEFNESLVEDHSDERVYNTLDAEHFFNHKTLSSGLTSNRLLAATPSFLTAIGVLGTFMGLTMGLRNIDIGSGDIEVLKTGITGMMSGAAFAFVTSVWGVGLSLLLNFIEKIAERFIISNISNVQQRIDFLYPRLPAEKSLVAIQNHTKGSEDALNGLAEQIGNRLQETISGVSDSMQEAFTNALNNVMAPAMQSLVSNTSQQTSGVLEQLIGNFTESMQAAGRGQGELMQKSTEEMRAAVSKLSDQMNGVLEQNAKQSEMLVKQQESASGQFNDQLSIMLTKTEERQQIMEKQLFAAIGSQQQSQAQRESQHIDSLQSVLGEWLKEQSQKLTHLTESMSSVQVAIGESTQGYVQKISAQTEKTSSQQQAFADGLESSLQNFMGASETRQKQLEENFATLLASQQEESSKRDIAYREQLQSQLSQWLSQQDKMLSSMTDAVHRTQAHMDEVIQKHKEVIGELKTVADSTATSSQNLNNSSNQIGVLSGNLLKATELFDTRLTETTDTIKNISAQNDALASHVIEQAKVLRGLETSLVSTADKFGETAQLAQTGFSEMKAHQTEFTASIESSFGALGENLTKQVSDIEKQTNDWLRTYSSEVNTQVKERMDIWNDTTREFSDQMRRTVQSIAELVDELESK